MTALGAPLRRRADSDLDATAAGVAALVTTLAGQTSSAVAGRPPAYAQALRDSLVAWALGVTVREAAAAQGRSVPRLRLLEAPAFPLAGDPAFAELVAPSAAALVARVAPAFGVGGVAAIALLGALQERLVDLSTPGEAPAPGAVRDAGRRKRSGSFYTPSSLAAAVVAEALAPHRSRLAALPAGARAAAGLALRVCDPAMGAGVFLVEVCRQLSALLGEAAAGEADALALTRRRIAESCLYGCDVEPIAVAVTEAALWLFVDHPGLALARLRAQLLVADALAVDGARSLPRRWLPRAGRSAAASRGFDLVVGNPPWVAFAGRAAQPLSPPRRREYAAAYAAWRGYPTLHGMFVERAAQLAPRGTVALIVPSSLADLDGYRSVRHVLTRSHVVREPLRELGQDAFVAVVQPSLVLLADPAPAPVVASDRPWRLLERSRAGAVAVELAPPPCLRVVAGGPPLPAETFRELGFQSNRIVTQELLRRASTPDRIHAIPLLEGRDVSAFSVGPARLFLCGEPARLRSAGVRLRPRELYAGVDFVVRQTAAFPIAARHSGHPFRNSLLAGFGGPGLPTDLLVGLLNSTLFRALHLAGRRDARQAAFPQVKLSHLRALPTPPPSPSRCASVARLAVELTRACQVTGGLPLELVAALDVAVFDLYALDADQRAQVSAFYRSWTAPSAPALTTATEPTPPPTRDPTVFPVELWGIEPQTS